ncbi:RNA polymerase sigma factor [Pontibacillus halophilus]
MNDEELYQRLLNGDKEALEALYDKYEKLLFSMAYRTCQQNEMAEEAVQELFLKLWTRRAKYDSTKGKFSSWLLTVMRYTAIDLLKKKENQNYTLEDNKDYDEYEPSTEDLLEWKERGEMLRKAVQTLSNEQASIVNLFYFKGLTQREIADHLNLSLGTVKGRIRLALKHLKKELGQLKEKGGLGDVT